MSGTRPHYFMIYLLILISSCAEWRIRRTVSSSIWPGLVLQLLSPRMSCPGARFTKYLMSILRLFYDNAKVTIDLR